jgi:hypothetical protein
MPLNDSTVLYYTKKTQTETEGEGEQEGGGVRRNNKVKIQHDVVYYRENKLC